MDGDRWTETEGTARAPAVRKRMDGTGTEPGKQPAAHVPGKLGYRPPTLAPAGPNQYPYPPL